MQSVRAQIGDRATRAVLAVVRATKSWNGMVTHTPHGLPFDLVKSALQKYIRRGESSEAEWCAIEIDSLGVLDDADAMKAVRSSRTNVVAASLGEDCLDPSCILRVVDQFCALIDALGYRDSAAGMACFIRIVRELTAARKGRMASVVKMYALRLSMPQQWQDKWGAVTAPPPGKTFEALLEAGDMRAASVIPATPPSMVWRVMLETKGCTQHPLAHQAIVCLRRLHQGMPNFGEKTLFIWQAVYLCVAANRGYTFCGAHPPRRGDELELAREDERARGGDVVGDAGDVVGDAGVAGVAGVAGDVAGDAGDVVESYTHHLSDVGCADVEEVQRLRIADYCVDKHTKQGRAMGKTVVDFAIEGSKVENPNQDLLPRAPEMDQMEQMYMDSKTMAGGGSKRGATSASASASKKPRTCSRKDDGPQGAASVSAGSARVSPQSVPFVQPDDAALASANKLQERTCGNKPMTWSMVLGGKRVVLKPITSSSAQLQHVLAPMVVDACKAAFGLAATNVTPVKLRLTSSSKKGDVGAVGAVGADRYALERTSDMHLWIQMDLVEGARGGPAVMVTDCRRTVFGSPDLFQQYCKVACFRWLLRVSDFNPRNVLLGKDDTLYSIDEARVGSRTSVFGRVAKEQHDAMKRFPAALAAAAADITGDLDAKLARVAQALRGLKSAYAPSLDPDGIVAYMRTNAGLLTAQLTTLTATE
jgi:hypothetical protein